jgi:hypothetical protein
MQAERAGRSSHRGNTYVRGAFVATCLIGSVGPGVTAIGVLRMPATVREMSKIVPLPEFQAPWLYWVLLFGAVTLAVAAVLEIARVPWAAPIALVASLPLWRFFGPGLWARVTGDGFFWDGRSWVLVSWPQLTYHIAATACAAVLTSVRYGRTLRR